MTALVIPTADEMEAAQREVGRVESMLRDRNRQITRLESEIKVLAASREADAKTLASIAAIHPKDQVVPKWLAKAPSKRGQHATPILMLSDLHLDEVVDLRDMSGMNEYNRQIAENRLSRVIDFTAEYYTRYQTGFQYDGIVCALLGDIITGTIHDELAETNDAAPPATIVHWVPWLASALRYLADAFGRVHVPCVDGNHDRTTDKTRMKKRAENSYSWIIYNWLADAVRDDPRITFSISPSSDQILDVYDTKFLLVHGDGFRGGGGVGGIYPSMLKYLYRQQGMWAASGQAWDYALMGHWHSLMFGTNFVVNGSLKGYDEYARRQGFGFEEPRQALLLITPERGLTVTTAAYGTTPVKGKAR